MTEADQIEVLTEFSRQDRYPVPGVYLLRSGSAEVARHGGNGVFRIGETRNLSNRSNAHRSGGPRRRRVNPPNWTQIYRPWAFIWAAAIPNASYFALKMGENHLFATFARAYEFIDNSGFEAPAGAETQLIDLANAELPILREIAIRQQREKFDKHEFDRAKWA